LKIPNQELHYSQIAAYGSGGIELDPGVVEPGCPDLYHARYVAKSRVAGWTNPLLTYGSVVHHALYLIEEESISQDEALERAWDASLSMERWEEAQKDLRRVIERGGIAGGLHTVAVEQALSTELGDGLRYGGVIDVVAVDDDVQATVPTLYFTDWKTDRGVPTIESVRKWKQGVGYAMLLYDNFQQYVPWADDVRIVGIYDAIKRYPITMEYPLERIEAFRSWALAIYKIIEADTDHEPSYNPQCGWCPIRHDCKVWLGMPGKAEGVIARTRKKALRPRAQSLEEMKKTKSNLEQLIKETEGELKDQIHTTKKPFKVKGGEFYLDQGQQREVDMLEVARLMGDDFVRYAKVTLGDLDAWKEEHLDVSIDHAIRTIPSTYRLKYRKDDQ